MERLVKKSGDFSEKGISVLCVHAGDAGQAALNEWLKDHNVPFAAKTITQDAEKTRFAWGVKSLPWLILTDNKHIVEANGFSLAELDEKI
jgi:hypothetical protein